MRLFIEVLEREVNNLMRMNVRVQVIGLMDELPSGHPRGVRARLLQDRREQRTDAGRGAQLRCAG